MATVPRGAGDTVDPPVGDSPTAGSWPSTDALPRQLACHMPWDNTIRCRSPVREHPGGWSDDPTRTAPPSFLRAPCAPRCRRVTRRRERPTHPPAHPPPSAPDDAVTSAPASRGPGGPSRPHAAPRSRPRQSLAGPAAAAGQPRAVRVAHQLRVSQPGPQLRALQLRALQPRMAPQLAGGHAL